ncbi:MAG: alpha/beta hydrolase [Chloroflexi bacterium]|nr:MAG: alpha/beta hydrolase [Chloroflexota bacterium]
MSVPVSSGINVQTINTSRLSTRVLFKGDEQATPVLFVHGNASSATWWEPTILALPEQFRAIAPDLRGYGDASPDAKIDATKGAGDWSDDLADLLSALNIEKVHMVAISMGGAIAWQFMMDHAEKLLSVTVVNPCSPYGYGGTKDIAGTPCYDDYAGSGAGLVNPLFVERIAAKDTGTDHPFSPRKALQGLVTNPASLGEFEDAFLAALLSVHLGEQDYPGDVVASTNWPYFSPGIWGSNNAISPKYIRKPDALYAVSNKPPVLWIRGDRDLTVADSAAIDPATLGKFGLIPNYPGEETYPAQPMVSQTRAVLEQYQKSGGSYKEVVLESAGHLCYMDKPDEFNKHLFQHLSSV